MPVCFYNASGAMAGADWHDYVMDAQVGPVPVPVPIKAFHFVMASFEDRCDDDTMRLTHVTSDRRPMIQGDFKLVYVLPHVPITAAPPHPVEAVVWGTIFVLSGSTALLAVATVTGEGKPLACCVYESFGANVNCGEPIDMPTGIVHNSNTVLTQPTADDFARAVLDWAVSGLISKIVGGLFDAAVKKYAGKVLKKWLKEALYPIRKYAEDLVKGFIEEFAKYFKDPVKSRTKAKATLVSLGVTHV
jgi:hypothetical protein